MVIKRRRAFLLKETIWNITPILHGETMSVYLFGSQTEASTTHDLNSDLDVLSTINKYRVIQYRREWLPGFINYLMIQDESVPPGYCLLQLLKKEAPIPENEAPNAYHVEDKANRVLLKNDITPFIPGISEIQMRSGPAQTHQNNGIRDADFVSAIHCKSWPLQAMNWLDQQGSNRWPSDQMKRLLHSSGCFVVGVGSRGCENEPMQWTISTSLAERCLMFNLNITQLRCFILMKMILKQFICIRFENTLSSFMCKTVLLHCIKETPYYTWRENNLLSCLTTCLNALYCSILCGNCPHYILHKNNLMRGKISSEIKPQLLDTVSRLIRSHGEALLKIETDDLGRRLLNKFNLICGVEPCLSNSGVEQCPPTSSMEPRLPTSGMEPHQSTSGMEQRLPTSGMKPHIPTSGMEPRLPTSGMERCLPTSVEICEGISGLLSKEAASGVSDSLKFLCVMTNQTSDKALQICLKNLKSLQSIHMKGDSFVKAASRLLTPFLCTSVGSILASDSLNNGAIAPQALEWFTAGLTSDCSSSRLKLATVFLSARDFHRVEFILKDIEQTYDLTLVEPVCECHIFGTCRIKKKFNVYSLSQNEAYISNITAICTRFMHCEINRIPHELQYELFRSTPEDLSYRNPFDSWMDLALVDSVTYLYFLQYKTYGGLGRKIEQQHALKKLVWTIYNEPNLGHRETALNLLGQCLEQENRHTEALRCYQMSLAVQKRNNIAKVHICRVFANLINAQ